MIISTMKEMETNTTDVLLTYFCRFLVPMVMVIFTVTFRSSSANTSRPLGSGIMMATTSPVPERRKTITGCNICLSSSVHHLSNCVWV